MLSVSRVFAMFHEEWESSNYATLKMVESQVGRGLAPAENML